MPLADFFQSPSCIDALLAPDGKSVALLLTDMEDKVVLAIMPTGGGQARGRRQPAVKAGNLQVEWVDYREERDGWVLQKTRSNSGAGWRNSSTRISASTELAGAAADSPSQAG